MNLFNSSGKNARLIGTVVLIMTFAVGGLAGAAGERVLRADDAPHHKAAAGEMRGGPGPRRMLLDEQFAKELKLTDAQRTEIRRILDERDVQAKQVWNEVEPRLQAVGESTRQEMHKVLSAEQVEKLETVITQRKASWKERHKCHADIDSAHANAMHKMQ